MNYDSMSAEDILRELWMFGQTRTVWGTSDSPFVLTSVVDHERDLVAALRKAVIREASVGEIEVKVRESGDELSRPNDPDRIVTVSEQFICQTWIPEGKYALVKKETP